VPKTFGNTILDLNVTKNIFTKTQFSMCTPEVNTLLGGNINSIILCGLETHICVLQTAFDLVNRDFNVTVLGDAVSSQRYDLCTSTKRSFLIHTI
jgi:nicotinamidase-related amidase